MCGDEVLDDLVLPVHGDGLPGQGLEVDAVALVLEEQLDALVHHPFAVQPIGQPGLGEQIDGPVLEDAGPDTVLDVFAGAVLDDDRLDAA